MLRVITSLFILFISFNSISFANIDDISIEKMQYIKRLSSAVSSKDGKKIIFCINKLTKDNSPEFHTHIYLKDITSNSLEKLTEGEHNNFYPVFTKDENNILFLSNRTGKVDIFIMPITGGNPVQLTDMPTNIETFKLSNKGDKLAFVSDSEVKDTTVKVIAEDYPIKSLYMIAVEPKLQNPTLLTTAEYKVKGLGDFGNTEPWFDFNADDTEITFNYLKQQNVDSVWINAKLATVNLATQQITKLDTGYEFSAIPRYSIDNSKLAFFIAKDKADYGLGRNIAILDLKTKQTKVLADTPDGGYFLAGSTLLSWLDNEHIVYYEPYKTSFKIYKINTRNSSIEPLAIKQNIYGPSLSPDNKYISFVHERSDTPAEIWLHSVADNKTNKITSLNTRFINSNMPKTQKISWVSTNNTKIEGLLTLPNKGTKPYPTLVVVHGGPMGFFPDSFIGNPYPYHTASFADAGFAVFRPNPRGSAGYGRDFRYAVFEDWGGEDYQDIMHGIDYLVEKGIADNDKLGIMGWSYGGYMTAWAITKSNRFKAASMGAGITNLISQAYTSDIHSYVSDYFRGQPWEKAELMLQRSPLTYVNKVTTPLLIQHGHDDKRVPFSQSLEFYNALKRNGQDVTLVGYPDMPHNTGSSAVQQLDVIKSNIEFFKDYLL